MKVTCLQENLARALSLAGRAVAPRTATLPVLTHVLLATDNGRLKVAATNLELGISCWIGAKVESEGAVTVPARVLSELVSLLPPDQVELELNVRTQALRVRGGHTDASIKGIDAQEFPIIPTFDAASAALVSPSVLKKLIAQVAFAATTDEARPNLTGVLTKLEDQQITMVATDGFRLSLRKDALHAPVAAEGPLSLLIPAKALTEVARALGEQEKPVAISVTPSHGQVLFHMESVDVVAQLIDQKFPPYESIIPRKWDTRVVVNTAEFLKACRQASVFARESADAVRLSIKASDELGPGRMLVSARAAESGENVTELEAAVSGSSIEIGFNVRFLIEALNAVDAPQVALEMTTPTSPAMLRAVGDDQFLHLIMPMHLSRAT
ncbi:MAG: DNA polymerase III subunit beta [Thermoflexales bacterium]|nr:DNA polymerase III subunit beta [Thermoflexales bacterium]MCS7324452.1 DNA polymerase III subunit beta [Thermoflexales bacterium]MCX7939681.1 DNA polymerase III subunit beta [Thermoflexales bacterium]MDW8054271.1 DNA polymerase III subunit beta [Anaerolineae bacterium]MDW8291567.1 DNA polymerase III subunit beta [Anaerolineae bacterium]